MELPTALSFVPNEHLMVESRNFLSELVNLVTSYGKALLAGDILHLLILPSNEPAGMGLGLGAIEVDSAAMEIQSIATKHVLLAAELQLGQFGVGEVVEVFDLMKTLWRGRVRRTREVGASEMTGEIERVERIGRNGGNDELTKAPAVLPFPSDITLKDLN